MIMEAIREVRLRLIMPSMMSRKTSRNRLYMGIGILGFCLLYMLLLLMDHTTVHTPTSTTEIVFVGHVPCLYLSLTVSGDQSSCVHQKSETEARQIKQVATGSIITLSSLKTRKV